MYDITWGRNVEAKGKGQEERSIRGLQEGP